MALKKCIAVPRPLLGRGTAITFDAEHLGPVPRGAPSDQHGHSGVHPLTDKTKTLGDTHTR